MKTLIVTGGNINKVWAKTFIQEEKFEYIIGADSGLAVCDALELNINLILGDYDSLKPEIYKKYESGNIEMLTYPCEKDYTDTELALHIAIERGADEITIIGGTGSRLDHTIANITIMNYALDNNVKCEIVNENNRIYIANKSLSIMKDKQYGNYISLLPLGGNVEGLTLTGFKYPLNNYCLEPGKSIGISNEIIEDKAEINFKRGKLIIFETLD